MGLDLDVDVEALLSKPRIRTSGRATRMPSVLGERELDSGESVSLTEREAGIKAPPVVRISARHRRLAQLLASGTSTGIAATLVGLTASRVSILKDDPAFQELLSFYGAKQEAAYDVFHERAASLLEDTVDTLAERLEVDPNSFTNEDLQRQVQVLADRTGHAPKRVEERNINLNFGNDLELARQRSKAAAQAALSPPLEVEDATVIEETIV